MMNAMLQGAGMDVTCAQILERAGDVTVQDYADILKETLALAAPDSVDGGAEKSIASPQKG